MKFHRRLPYGNFIKHQGSRLGRPSFGSPHMERNRRVAKGELYACLAQTLKKGLGARFRSLGILQPPVGAVLRISGSTAVPTDVSRLAQIIQIETQSPNATNALKDSVVSDVCRRSHVSPNLALPSCIVLRFAPRSHLVSRATLPSGPSAHQVRATCGQHLDC